MMPARRSTCPVRLLAAAVTAAMALLVLFSPAPHQPVAQAAPGSPAITPPLGWNSWNSFGCGVNETAVRQAADAMVDSGMRDAGYRYVVVDDCWFDPQRDAQGTLRAHPAKFPTKWRRENRPVETAVPVFPPAVFTARTQPQLRVTAREVLTAIGDREVTLVDPRDPGQYTGAVARPGNRPGHLPGALNIPREDLVDLATGTWHSARELGEIFAGAGLPEDSSVIAYCNGGVAAATVLFGLARAGYPLAANYDGSWNEWSAREDLPVETVTEGR